MIKARIENENHRLAGAVEWPSGTRFCLYGDKIEVDLGRNRVATFSLADLRDEARKLFKEPQEEAHREVVESKEDKILIHPDFKRRNGRMKLNKGWRDHPLHLLGIAYLLAERAGRKITLTRAGVVNLIRRYNEAHPSDQISRHSMLGKMALYQQSDFEKLCNFWSKFQAAKKVRALKHLKEGRNGQA